MALRSGSLFSGVAGLDHAAAEVFGAEPAWFCDNDAAAANVLAHHYPGTPMLGDIVAADWARVEPVGLVTAGWPCQPWSTAGRRRGIEDERALWPEVARAVRALRPGVIVLENVPAIAGAGELARACADLAALGYRFCWTVLGADEVGGCHRRNRCFILAVADTAGTRRAGHVAGAALSGNGAAAGVAGQVQPGGLDRPAPDADGIGPVRAGSARGRWSGPADNGHPAAHTESGRPARNDGSARSGPARSGGERIAVRDAGDTDWGIYTAAIRRWERVIGRTAPVPRITGPRGGLKLNPALPEWMQGFPAGWITDVPGVSVNDALRLAGNSVNPVQAVAALRWCAAQLAERAA